ncbi:MAG: hypothetical protein KF787_08925 [Phycisphaeraceae bacterium]|nr:hypothetical protein [Phycisphaeraceae bacterium]
MKWKEIAKFASGFEAFHAILHASLWLSGTSLSVFGIALPGHWNGPAAVLGTVLAVALAWYGWRRQPSSS